jgi:hydrogenase maturation factor
MLINLLIMFAMGLIVWLFFLRNFLLSWLKVKMPTTKYNVLVEVQHPIQNYFAPGQIEKNMLYYKGKKTVDNSKAQRIVDLTLIEKEVGIGSMVHRGFGVQNIRVDDAKGCCLYRDENSYRAISGYSPESIGDLVYDAQNRPSLEDGMIQPKMFQIIVIGLLCLTVVGVVMTYMQIGKSQTIIDGHLKMTYDYVVTIAKNMNITVITPQTNFSALGIGG